MNNDQGYKNKVYKDAGVERGAITKAVTTVLALILAERRFGISHGSRSR